MKEAKNWAVFYNLDCQNIARLSASRETKPLSRALLAKNEFMIILRERRIILKSHTGKRHLI